MIAFLTPFPNKSKNEVGFSALGLYTKTLLDIFDKNKVGEFCVLSQNSVKPYKYKNISIYPTWKRNSLFFFVQVIRQVKKLKVKKVHLQHEVYAFGTNQYLTPYLIILMIFLLRILGVQVTTTIHGVLPKDMFKKDFIKSAGVSGGSTLVKVGVFIVYFFTCFFSSKVVVHSNPLKQTLVYDYHAKTTKIAVIPHPLYKFSQNSVVSTIYNNLTKDYKYVFLYFGYLSMYKSLDILVKSTKHLNLKKHKALILVAGSVPNRLKSDENYKKYIKKFKDQSKGSSIVWDTRFIPDNEVEHYFKKCSALLLPYQFLVSASGPLSLALQAKTSVLASDSFKNILGDTFGKTPKHLAKAIEKFILNSSYRTSLAKSTQNLASSRSDVKIAKLYKKLYQ
jgi:glycosyltransferase involved in cell wall biosynthesis